MLRAGGLLDVLTALSDSRQETVAKIHGTENFVGFLYVLGRFPQRDLGLWVFMYPINNTLFCLYFVSFLSLFFVYLSGYHAEGYHVPSLPPRAITPVYTSRLPHQSYHAPSIHVHRVITPAISYSYFVVLSFSGFYATCASPPTPPLGATRHNLLNRVGVY